MQLSIIVPCFDEEENIRPFYEETSRALSGIMDKVEMIFIDDGSRDGTVAELKKLGEEVDTHIRIISFSRNFGKEAGLFAGLQAAKGDYVAIIDADLQQNPAYIRDMLQILGENPEYDCVAAYQKIRSEGKALSFLKAAFYKLINRLTDIEFYRAASDFRLLSRKMVDAILAMPERCRFSKGIFSWVGFNTHYIPYVAQERHAGTTNWSFWKLLKYALDGIISYTTFPLKIATGIGAVMSVLSLIYMVVVVIQKLFFGIAFPGYATIVVSILLIGGLQMIMLGIIGEYIARIYIQGKHRPIYIAKEYVSYEQED